MTIKEAREANHITQAETAKILGVSKRAVEEWEAGSRSPRGGLDRMIEKIKIAGHLTKEGRQALIEGDLSWQEATASYKMQTAKQLSKWGAYPDTFSANWNRIPEAIVETASGEALAELVDSIKETYDAGVDYGRNAE